MTAAPLAPPAEPATGHPLAHCIFCLQPVAHPLAPCDLPECEALWQRLLDAMDRARRGQR